MEKHNRLFTVLWELGLEPNPATFRERKRIQKLVYLAQEFGLELGFNFTWYIHGPYSPDLTTAIFDVMERNSQVEKIHLTSKEHSRLSYARDFLDEDIHSTEKLELLGSLMYLRKAAKKYNSSKQEIKSVLKEKKPYFSDDEIETCWRKLELANNYLQQSLS